ncbi:NAD-dependent epimerase/dehydratase [Salpingoeca rosetta]|uniref:NAD-dependent epimerase/dehydratase n=1 Tax=Salpingoeca rosetta (strain ATCC 50818 / BSB-021) TaxID=946362 RepID=F2UC84_SALR5|nr:NAD-dependent epimerase/dehydratase [Salpingoeca rosetta]EGD74191.1 NAD-dependent epimerase/dehydratase [Salpingoeca rosetta]|eukprot:XP_004993091.1 NAD-dependent epimerase/dehydratase [Salpingoeca rosetta]
MTDDAAMSGDKKVVAVLVGATGLVGSMLLPKLLADARYSRIIAPTRRPLQLEGATEKLVNPVNADVVEALPKGEHVDHVYICTGTTRKKTPDLEKYTAIEVGLPDKCAQWAADAGASYLGVVSSMGANARSKFAYTRLKGEMEQLVLAKDVPNVSILEPSVIFGKRNESRTGESIAKGVMGFFAPLIPRNYRGIHADVIAERLHADAFANLGKRTVLSGDIPVPKETASSSSERKGSEKGGAQKH